jgi:transposase InsO family protein
MTDITVRSQREAVALFRLQVLGSLPRRDLTRGLLRSALRELSQQRFRPPGSDVTRSYSVTTLERWYYRLRKLGIAGLEPCGRADAGRGRQLTQEQRELLLDIRREHPGVSVPRILGTLLLDGRLKSGTITESTLRRLYQQHGLDRIYKQQKGAARARYRWQAEAPGVLWHGDVCHGPALTMGKRKVPLRIHALLDDASRYIVGIAAFSTEREMDMLQIFSKSLRMWGAPASIYLDNGSTYRGETLATVCGRIGISLVHARPYDPQARGKMERFWGTLRQGCLNHMGTLSSLHDVHARLMAFVTQHYHRAPHAGLLGRSPESVWAGRNLTDLDEATLARAFTLRATRRVGGDGTVSVGGRLWETDHAYLARRQVTIARPLLEPNQAPWVEHEGRQLDLTLVNTVTNGRRKRQPVAARTGVDVAFDPVGTLLAANKTATDGDTGGEG